MLQVVDELAASGCEPVRYGDGWLARCPAHEKRNPDEPPGLLVGESPDGSLRLRCEVGCDREDVLGTLRLEHLFNESAEDAPASPTSDVSNAQRLVKHFGPDLRWTKALGWIAWTGSRWEPSETSALARAARLGRIVQAEAAEVGARASKAESAAERERLGELAKTLQKWARESEREPRVRAALNLARPILELDAARLDAQPFLLNTPSGTVDLRTGKLRPHRREDFLSKLTAAVFDPDATSEVWDRVLERALPDPALRDFLARAAGYTACGCGGEDVLLLVHGPTRTAKGTVQGAIAAALGNYSMTAGLEDLARREKGADGSRPRPELARLRGARLVSIYETGRSLRLDDALVKTLAGSDELTVRDLHRPCFTFRPGFVVWIATNHRPRVAQDDDALWARFREIPFDVQIPEEERNPEVRRRLADPNDAGPAVLRWIVGGALAYWSKGLAAPDRVKTATAGYRESMDRLGPFLAACCVLRPEVWTKSSELRTAYEVFCKESGDTPVSGKAFGDALTRHGFKAERLFGSRGWHGVGLVESEHDA
jgi:putative DNA primase/helicase